MDNYYKNCPAKMSEGRFLANWKSATVNNEYLKYKNGIIRDDDYRLFLQLNAEKLMDTEWLHLRKNDSCWNNACVHKYPLRMDPRDFAQERLNTDLLFKKQELPDSLMCEYFSDYRSSETPLQQHKIPLNCDSQKNN
jgi:hypothetical protein